MYDVRTNFPRHLTPPTLLRGLDSFAPAFINPCLIITATHGQPQLMTLNQVDTACQSYRLAHHAALLAQPLDLAAQHDDLEGELVGEGFLLLELLLIALQPSLVPLDVCGQPHDVVLRGVVRTCCSWSEISISPFLLSSGSSLEYWLRSSSY